MEWLLLFIISIALSGWLLTYKALKGEQTQRKAQNNRLNLLHKAIGAAHAGVFFYEVERNESIWDRNSLEMFGLGGEERYIAPGTWESIIHPDDLDGALTQVMAVLNGKGTLFNHTYRIVLPNNKIRWIEGTGFVIRDEHQQPLEITGFHFDVTNQIEYEQTLRAAESKALQAMDAKTQFLANMSHEIRTPMNAIVGMIELLNLEKPNSVQQRYINTLQNSSDVLLRIIDDILDVSKIEAGKLKLERKSFCLREVIGQCLTVYTQASDTQDILLSGWVDPTVPKNIIGDSTRLQQVIMNLLGNALKFTRSGHIILRVAPEGHSALRFSVTDTGIGIEYDKQAALFDRFSQADISTTRKFGGTGLGLTIVKDIVELWGGKISVNSVAGEGSNFTFVLPISQPWRKPEKFPGHVLLCTRYEMLSTLWHKDDTAPEMTWVQDIDSFRTELNQSSFTNIIVEQRFPGAQGSELIHWAKEKHPDIRTTLIGFEKYVQDEKDRESVDQYCARPFFINQLWDTHFTKTIHKSSALDSNIWPDYSHVRVLCVDDNQSNLMVLSGLLKRFSIQAQCVESGPEAIEIIKENNFDLILMDYEMPEMDGPETTNRILKIKWQLIVGLSAHVGEFFEDKAVSAGMSGFLRKPIKMVALAELLGHHFKLKTTTD